MGFYENGSAPSGETVKGGTDFYSDGPAYSAIDPVAIQNFVKQAGDSAAASEVSNKASKAQADASAASAATATTQAGIATTQAGVATSKASDASTSAAAALASQNAAKTSETNAKTSETNAKTSETNAAGSASTASTKAGDAATSAAAALASQNAAKTSETNSKTSETNAASSASAANTSKVNAGTSETNAAASAAAALTSKNNAATSETNAANSATAAAGSASTASTQAGNASTSATSAASSLTSFKAVWCGNSATDPTVNGNGGALTAGCLYWNTSSGTLKIYSGSSWGAYSAVSVTTVFGRSGAVTAQAGDYTFAQIGSKPTTLAGYGITDGMKGTNNLSEVADAASSRANLGINQTVQIGAGADLNTIIYPGTYYCTNNTLTNSPVSGGQWFIEVQVYASVGSGYLEQTAISLLGDGAIYNRVLLGGAWQPWRKVILQNLASSFTAAQSFTLATLTDAANIAWDVNAGQKAKVTIAGARTMNAVTNAVEGTTYFLWIIQDGAGSRTMAWTTTGTGSFDFGAAGAPTLTTTANRADLLCFEAVNINGTLKLRFCGIQKGFS